MARVLTAITLNAPSSPVTASVNDPFTFTGTPTLSGGGGVQRYDFRWEVNGGSGYVTIGAASGLTTADPNPLVNTNSQTANSITVTCTSPGSYTIRMAGAPSTGGAYTVLSSTQTVEVSAGPEQHTGTLSVSGGGAVAATAQKGAVAPLTVSGGGAASLTAFRGAVTALVTSGGGGAELAATTERQTVLQVSGGGSVAITASGETQPEEHSGSFSVSGGGGVTVAASTDRSTTLEASGGGAATFTVTSDRGSGVVITGGGSVSISHSASQGDAKSASVAVSGGGGIELETLAARLVALGVTGGGGASVAASTARFTSLSVSGGGFVNIGGPPLTPKKIIAVLRPIGVVSAVIRRTEE